MTYGAKSNDELLMTYGFAIQDNRFDSVPLALACSDAANAGIPIPEIRLTMQGVPQEVIDEIEATQNTAHFVGLLRAVLLRKRSARECLEQFPKALNYSVCKGLPFSKERKRSIEAFLEGQFRILEACLESMQTAQDDNAVSDGDEVGEMEEPEEEEEEEEEEYVARN